MITISYRSRTVTASNTDTVGRFPRHLPCAGQCTHRRGTRGLRLSTADKADGNDGKATLKAKTLHRVPGRKSWRFRLKPQLLALASLLLPPTSHSTLAVRVFIGNVLVAGSTSGELAESDGNGQWEGTPLVPQLTPGTHTVEMRVGTGSTGISVSTFLEIADIITRASEEAFR